MKSAGILPLTIMLATLSAIGQDIVPRNSSNSALWVQPPSPMLRLACPVDLEANHGSSFMRREVDGRELNPETSIQSLNLTLGNRRFEEIVSVTLIVHGFSQKWRTMPLADTATPPDLARTVNLRLDVKANGRASRDLWLSRFSAITSIDVTSLTYADGSTWQSSSPATCSAAPSMVMRISANR